MTRTHRTIAALLTVLSLAGAYTPSAYADTSSTANTGTLRRFYVNTDGRIFILLRNLPTNKADCLGGWYVIPANHSLRGLLFESLRTAWETEGTRVGLKVKDGHVDNTFCEVRYVVVDR